MLLRPGVEEFNGWFLFSGIDKIIHISIFALLGFTFMAAFPKTKFLAFLYIMVIYSLITEILQDEMQLGRSLEILDLLADILGFMIGFWLFKKIKSVTF